ATGALSGIAAGTVAVTYSVTNSCGSAATAATITAIPLPLSGIISGVYSVCPGSSTILSDAGSIGTGVWSSGNPLIATVNASGAVTGIAEGNANITYTASNTCGTATTYAAVTVNPSPEAGTI